MWKALGIVDEIEKALLVDRSGLVVLEESLRWPVQKSPILGHLGLQEVVAIGAWYIWWERREAKKGATVKNPIDSRFSIHAIASNHTGRIPENITFFERWVKPTPGSYKVNTYASFFEDGSGAIAAIIRDSREQKVAGATEPFSHAHDAASTEVLALRRGLLLASEKNCSRVTMESDCLEIIEACNGEKEIRAPYSALLADCFQVAHEIPTVKFM